MPVGITRALALTVSTVVLTTTLTTLWSTLWWFGYGW